MATSGAMMLARPWLPTGALGRVSIAALVIAAGALAGLTALRAADDRYVDEVWAVSSGPRRAARCSRRDQ